MAERYRFRLEVWIDADTQKEAILKYQLASVQGVYADPSFWRCESENDVPVAEKPVVLSRVDLSREKLFEYH